MSNFNAKTGMDIAFASIFVLAIGLTIADDTITTLVIGAGFLYMVARMTGVL